MKYFHSTHSKVLSEHVEAIVDKEIKAGKLWRVKFQKSYWFARLYQADSMVAGNGVSLRSGERVRVIAIQGITVLIQPLPEVSKQNQTESHTILDFGF